MTKTIIVTGASGGSTSTPSTTARGVVFDVGDRIRSEFYRRIGLDDPHRPG